MNLTKVNGCYSKELRENCNNLKICVKEASITVEQMKYFVLGIIEPAFINADAKKRFIANVNMCETKQEIDDLCREVVIHGMYYTPKRKAVNS